jgi:hypothetical protein
MLNKEMFLAEDAIMFSKNERIQTVLDKIIIMEGGRK